MAGLVGQRVVLVLAPHRGAEREERTVVYRGWAIPTFGTTSDIVIVQEPGYVAQAYSSSRVVSIDRAPA